MHSSELVKQGMWSGKVFGMPVFAVWDPREGQGQEDAAKRDLLWYVNEFLFAGCGGPFHRFADVDATSLSRCLQCGVTKKIGLHYDAAAILSVWPKDLRR